MKVAVLTHFQGFPPSYALAVGWHERAVMLKYFGVDFDFFVAKNCKEGLYPNQKAVLKTIPGSRPFDYKVEQFTEQYLELLEPYDVVLTADLIYQRKGNFLAYNQAMRNTAEKIKAWWCHWIHSSWTERPSTVNTKDPDSLRYTMMPRSFLVYLNAAEAPNLQQMYQTDLRFIRVVHNPKDPRVFLNMHPFSVSIIDRLKLYGKDAVCIFPHCSTRMDAKGIDGVIDIMAALKRKGCSIGLVFCNANARKVQQEIAQKKTYMANQGLVENEDYMFTHDMDKYKPMPRKVIRDLLQVSNVFIFASWRETTGNAFQEAQITDNLLVLNKNIPCLHELARDDNKRVWLDFSHKTPGRQDGKTGDFQLVNYHPTKSEYFDSFVWTDIIPKLPSKRYMWSFSMEKIWYGQFKPLLEEATRLANSAPIGDEGQDQISWDEYYPDDEAAVGLR